MMYFVYIWFTVFNYLIETEQGNEHQYKKKTLNVNMQDYGC